MTFGRHGEQTKIGRQFVSYPFHFTRPFSVDRQIPSLLTLYQQSSSGGLYRGDRLEMHLEIAAGAAAHLTTQAATVVHDCHGMPAHQQTEIDVEHGGFLALTPDPLILFPGASVVSDVSIRFADGAVVLQHEAFTWHDPSGLGRMFDHIASDIKVSGPHGETLLRDRFHVDGQALRGAASPVGAWRVVTSHLVLGDLQRLPSRDLLAFEAPDAVTGVSALPNDAGWCVRSLAANASAARRVADRVFSACIVASFGAPPAPRRK